MAGSTLALFLLFCCAGPRGTLTWQGQCQPKTSCKECIRSPGCAWCKQQGFLKPGEPAEWRCSSAEALRSRNCSEGEVINPRTIKEVLEDSELRSDSDNVVQLRPQKVHLKLRVGVPHTFKVMFKRAEGYPIDLYYLMELSYSMQDDLENVKQLGQKIFDALRNVTPAVRIGFGSFVDKVALPFVNTGSEKLRWPCPKTERPCQPAFGFKNILSLTDDAEEFRRRVGKENISANLDSAEAGFDAVMQAAVCQNHIGWGNATRILVYASDDTFHTAGDGKMAGIYLPADGKCHLDSEGFYDKDALYDYPSVGHLSEIVSANKINVIFAVTRRNYDSYMELSELIPQSVVRVLREDSSNVVQLISEACEKLTSTVILNHQDAPPGLNISYSSHCFTGVHIQGQKRGECHNVQTNQQVNFTVTVSSSVCLEGTETFVIKLQGLGEEIQVSVDTQCDCNCQDQEEKSPSCSTHGTLICGVCSCDTEHTGQRCECRREEDEYATSFQDSGCRQTNASALCSGHGRCECGRCVCRGRRKGDFCQCDDTSCDRHDNRICGGKGTCNCGVCECFPDHTGSACQCSSLRDRCRTGSSGECSNRGLCKCNKCHCQPGFYGERCAQIEAPCQTYLACARCTLSSVGGEDVHRLCSKTCGAAKLIHANSTLLPCGDIETSFRVELDSRDGSILLYYAHPVGSVYVTTVIVLSAVLGVLFIGIVFLLIYRLLLEVIYQIQHCNFEKKRQRKY